MDFEWIDVWFNTWNLKKTRRVDLRESSLMKELPNFPEAGASKMDSVQVPTQRNSQPSRDICKIANQRDK